MSYPVMRVRRKRKSRSRRRIRRAMVLASLLLVAFSFWVAFQRLGPPSSWFATDNASSWEKGDPSRNLAILASRESWSLPAALPRRSVYGYSLIAGGVRSPEELQQATARDPELAEHYAGFDFTSARVIEVDQPKLVYLSYKLRGKLYWTKGKHPLHKGEKLITDGKIIARARCGNRVSESAQKAVSSEEPPAEMFEVPIYSGDGSTELPYPGGLDAGLLNRPDFPQFELGPGATAGLPGGWGFPPIFPPPVPGTCTPPGEKSGGKKKNPCPGPPPAPVPEPGTLLLVSSGIAGVYWRCRRKSSQKRSGTLS